MHRSGSWPSAWTNKLINFRLGMHDDIDMTLVLAVVSLINELSASTDKKFSAGVSG